MSSMLFSGNHYSLTLIEARMTFSGHPIIVSLTRTESAGTAEQGVLFLEVGKILAFSS